MMADQPGVDVVHGAGAPGTVDEAESALRAEKLEPRPWSNGPGAEYGWHRHPAPKILYCVRGGIVFHTRRGDVQLSAGDRLVLDAGVDHAATVGPQGVLCVEAYRS